MAETARERVETLAQKYGDAPDASLVQDEAPDKQTVSATSTYQGCPLRWFYRYVLHLTPAGLAQPLVTGRLYHEGLEYLLKSHQEGDMDIVGAMEHVRAETLKMFDKASPMDGDKLNYGWAQASAMVKAWPILNGELLESYEILAVEAEFSFDEHNSKFARAVGGKVDLVLRHLMTEQIYVSEHKSRSTLGTLDFGTLVLDMQANIYSYAINAEGFLYDVMQKPAHRVSAKTGSYEELSDRMYKAMMDTPDKYAALEPIPCDGGITRNIVFDFNGWGQLMKHEDPQKTIRNLGACDNVMRPCPYKSLCRDGGCSRSLKSIYESPAIQDYKVDRPNSELEAEDAE